jgi:glycosyltransferase involved in cell wall biosynthesis
MTGSRSARETAGLDREISAQALPLTVCLILEGSYPFITGGVSAWVQELISALPEIHFKLYTLSPKRGMTSRYVLPPNVTEHKDLVIGERQRARAQALKKDELLSHLKTMHAAFASGSVGSLREIITHLPEGSYLYEDAVNSEEGWEMIVAANQDHNPIYPFADYFWSWKASHDLVFTVLGATPPEADLYHAISTGYAGLAGVTAKLRTGRPLLLTEHGLYHKEREMEIKRASFVRGYQRDLWIRMYYGLSRMCYRSADLVVSLFEYNRRRQMELGAEEDKAVVIPNGIDIARFSSVVREKREGFHVGFVGRVVPIKDVKTFILMAKIVADALPDARFHCIGPIDEDPAYYEDCRILVKSFRLEERFTFAGKQDVMAYYAFLDVLVLSSIREAQPLVILEAFAAGLPVVSTMVGNVPELLDFDERFLAPSKDAGKLARAVRYVHDQRDETAEIARINKEKVVRFYDKTDVYRRYGKIYADLVRSYTRWRESASS